MSNKLESLGPTGAVIAAAACPICFPKLAAIGALFGLGVLAPVEAYFFFGALILITFTFLLQALAYKRHRNRLLLASFAILTAVFFLSLYAYPSEALSYLALGGIVLCTVWSIFTKYQSSGCEVRADITHPH